MSLRNRLRQLPTHDARRLRGALSGALLATFAAVILFDAAGPLIVSGIPDLQWPRELSLEEAASFITAAILVGGATGATASCDARLDSLARRAASVGASFTTVATAILTIPNLFAQNASPGHRFVAFVVPAVWLGLLSWPLLFTSVLFVRTFVLGFASRAWRGAVVLVGVIASTTLAFLINCMPSVGIRGVHAYAIRQEWPQPFRMRVGGDDSFLTIRVIFPDGSHAYCRATGYPVMPISCRERSKRVTADAGS